MNMSGLFDPPLPTLQREDAFLYIPHGHSNYAAEWVQEFFTVGTNGSEFVYSDTIPYTLSDSSWLCFNRMVITGTFGALVGVLANPSSMPVPLEHVACACICTRPHRYRTWRRPLISVQKCMRIWGYRCPTSRLATCCFGFERPPWDDPSSMGTIY